MNRSRHVAVLVLLSLVCSLLLPAVATAAESPAVDRQVVVVLAPYITWADITGGAMPVTRTLADRGTIGNLNVRSSWRFAQNPPQAHVAVTMSAGSPAAFDLTAPAAYDLDQRLEVGTAAEAYRRSMGADPGEVAIAYLGLPRVLRANTATTLATMPGALGEAIVRAGGATAAVGNSDGGYVDGEVFRSRPAAILAMDARGLVTFGTVSTELLVENSDAPYGLATDLTVFESAAKDALTRLTVHGGPGLLVLDPGDPERAFNFTIDASPDAAEKHRLAAAAAIDKVVAMAEASLPADAVLIVVPTGQARPATGPAGFGPVVIAGPEFEAGLVGSPSTHRPGLMTDLDVAATILGVLGIDRPVDVLGNAVTAAAAPAAQDRYDYLETMNATAVAVDTVRPIVQNSYITLTVIVLLACAALLRPMQRGLDGWGGHVAHGFGHLILFLLSMPVAATLMYLAVPRPASAMVVAVLFGATTLIVFVVALLAQRRWGASAALAVVGLLSAGVLLADQVVGARLSFSGMFSYSPLLGARYYGLGNEGASIIVGGGLAGLTLLLDAFRDKAWTAPVRRWGPLVLGVLVVVISAAPFMGANVGVIAWGTVAFGILWVQLNGRRVTWKTVLAMGVVIVLAVAAFSLLDLGSSAGGQTHLGRAWESAESGGIGQLWLIVARKAETNWRVLRATNWSILMIAILAFLGFMRWRPQGVFAETLRAYPSFAVAMTASLWASLVGYFTEDSGIVIPALVMLYITGSLLNVMLARLRQPAEELA